jgi:hypothetical protein
VDYGGLVVSFRTLVGDVNQCKLSRGNLEYRAKLAAWWDGKPYPEMRVRMRSCERQSGGREKAWFRDSITKSRIIAGWEPSPIRINRDNTLYK